MCFFKWLSHVTILLEMKFFSDSNCKKYINVIVKLVIWFFKNKLTFSIGK